LEWPAHMCSASRKRIARLATHESDTRATCGAPPAGRANVRCIQELAGDEGGAWLGLLKRREPSAAVDSPTLGAALSRQALWQSLIGAVSARGKRRHGHGSLVKVGTGLWTRAATVARALEAVGRVFDSRGQRLGLTCALAAHVWGPRAMRAASPHHGREDRDQGPTGRRLPHPGPRRDRRRGRPGRHLHRSRSARAGERCIESPMPQVAVVAPLTAY